MYKIIFKGQMGEEFVETFQGKQLSDDWKNGALPSKVEINGNLYESSSIKAIVSGFNSPDHTDQNAEHLKMIDDMWHEFNQARAYKMTLSLEKRAEDTSLAEMLFAAYGVPFPRETVVAAQLKSFQEFPHFAQAKPTYYKHLLGHVPSHKDGEAMGMNELIPLAALNLAERVIANSIT